MAPEFSTIVQAPEIRALVQENLLERAFHDSLYPRLLFRMDVAEEEWAANVGDSMFFTAPGLIPVRQRPLVPGEDPQPESYGSEQWQATLQQYASSVDTHMPTSITAIANLFLRNSHQLGLQSGQTMNRIVRNRLYNAALAGHTVADGTAGAANVIRVARLNGFTTARTASGDNVRFNTVSGSNPLPITIGGVARNVTGFTPDTAGDEIGPGTITVDGAAIAVTDRDPILAVDKTFLVRVGGGDSNDAIGASDIFDLAAIRDAVSRFWTENVPECADGRFHCHLDPKSMSQVFNDPEWQRLLTSLPDYYMYKQFALGELLGTLFYRNSENPQLSKVDGNDGTTEGFSLDDPFAGELFSDGTTTGTKVHRALFMGADAIYEYAQPLDMLITEAGVTGKVGEPQITNNGIRVNTDRIQVIIRAPLNRLQDQVATSWKFIGDWPIRTDAAVGDAARYKRLLVVEHGE